MRRSRLLVVVAVLLALSAAGFVLWPESDDPQSVCERQLKEDKGIAFTEPVTDDQVEDLCRRILNGEPFLGS